MTKLMVMLALASLMISVPAAFAVDLNRNGIRQIWAEQLNLEKQQAKIWGLAADAPKFTAPETSQQVTVGKGLQADRFQHSLFDSLSAARRAHTSWLPSQSAAGTPPLLH